MPEVKRPCRGNHGEVHDIPPGDKACRLCAKLRRGKKQPELRDKLREWRRKNPHLVRARLRQYVTGWSHEMVLAARIEQEGKCAICTVVMDTENKQKAQGEHADHCHETGATRALLCSTCNTSLGRYEKYQRPSGLRLDGYEMYLNRFKK